MKPVFIKLGLGIIGAVLIAAGSVFAYTKYAPNPQLEQQGRTSGTQVIAPEVQPIVTPVADPTPTPTVSTPVVKTATTLNLKDISPSNTEKITETPLTQVAVTTSDPVVQLNKLLDSIIANKIMAVQQKYNEDIQVINEVQAKIVPLQAKIDNLDNQQKALNCNDTSSSVANITKTEGNKIIQCSLLASDELPYIAEIRSLQDGLNLTQADTPAEINSQVTRMVNNLPVIYSYSVNPLTGIGTLYNINNSSEIYHISCTSISCNISNY